MKIYYELDLNNFKAWSGAVDTLERIKNAGKVDELEYTLNELYPEDELDETELNDILWFESDTVYQWLGMRTEGQIKEELTDLKNERQNLLDEFEWESEGISEEEKVELHEEEFEFKFDEINEQIEELEEELEEI